MSAIDDIAAERRRQIEVEGWTPEHDDDHRDGSLALVASFYANPDPEIYTPGWPGDSKPRPARWPHSWSPKWWKPTDRRRDLVKACALIVAEIERMDRTSLAPHQCRHCFGLGQCHTPVHSDDPMDSGVACPVCGGSGAVVP